MRAALRAMLAVSIAPGQAQSPDCVELYLLDDASVAKANAAHLGCMGPTNILSFPGGGGFLGALGASGVPGAPNVSGAPGAPNVSGAPGAPGVPGAPNVPGAPGALLLSLDTLQRECLLYGQDPAEHLVRLLAHGMGHLRGLDHGPVMDALCERHMEAAWAVLSDEEGCGAS